MSEHTPGPWLTEGRIVYATGKIQSLTEGRTLDANRFSAHVQNDNAIADDRELLANARLIAAAPDLLDALVFARFRLKEVGLLFDEIDSAIAKATDNE